MICASQSVMLREFGIFSCVEFKDRHLHDNLKGIRQDNKEKFKINLSPIIEIVPTSSLLFVINSMHRCMCVEKFSHKILFDLTGNNENSRTVYFNKYQNAMILVILVNDESGNRLKCRSYCLADLEKGLVNGVELFKEEDLRNPGFIEFDDANKLVLTRSMESNVFKLWKLENYELCYAIKDPNVEEIRLTNELIMLIHSPRETSVICKLCSVMTGNVLDVFDIDIKPHRMIELLELFSNFMLIKQYGEPLLIVNLLTMEKKEIRGFISPQNFIYLFELKLFLALRSCVIEVWNFDGKLVKVFGAPSISQHGDLIPNRLFISRGQDLILISCNESRNSRQHISGSASGNSIRIYKLETGELILELKDKVLEDLSTITFDEDFDNLYTGHTSGELVRWGN